jgi:translation initiation factor IF-2
MSSTEMSGAAPAEATATTPAPAATVTFGTSRGSGLSRGKRPAPAGPANASTPAADYKPTAIEVVQAPREYQNPFAPAGSEPVAQPADAAPSIEPAAKVETPAAVAAPPSRELFPLDDSPADAPEAKTELNILAPAEQKTAPAQTWESEGFRAPRDDASDRLARADLSAKSSATSESAAGEPAEVDLSSIPPQFLYVRPGVKFTPTPRNWGSSEPRPRRDESRPSANVAGTAPERAHAAPEAPGFFGWLKSLFGGSKPAAKPEARDGEHRHHRRHRVGPGESYANDDHGGERRDRGGRRRRGGRDRGPRRSHGEPEGSRQGGSI